MELRQYFLVLRRWWWLLVLGAALPAAAAYFLTKQQPKTYQATATLLVNVSSNGSLPSYYDALLSQSLVKTYSQMAAQPVVVGPALARLGLDPTSPNRHVTISPYRDTQLMTISVEGRNPAEVSDVANTIAAVFIEQQNARVGAGQASNAISVAQPAIPPTSPIGPRPTMNTVLAGAVGAMLMVGLVFLLEYLDDTIKTPDDLRAQADLSTIGTVRRFDNDEQQVGGSLIMDPRHEASTTTEAYRLLSANLEFVLIDQQQWTVLVTSARPGEGKSTTVANLGLALARTNKRVIVLDSDLRKPSQHQLFKLSNSTGFTTLMLERSRAPLQEQIGRYLQQGPVPNLKVLTTGPLPPNPAELISSDRFAQVLAALKQIADVVILDSAPVSAVADTLFLAQRAAATVLVVDSGKTRAGVITAALETLQKSGTRVVGGVLNKVHGTAKGYYYDYGRGYGYGYGYGRGSASTNGNGAHPGEVVGTSPIPSDRS